MQKSNIVQVKPFKLVLLGNGSVGKTAFILRICQNHYYNNMIITTNCESFKTEHTLDNGQKVKCEIWDTAGANHYISSYKMIAKESEGIILCYDITCSISFSYLNQMLCNISTKHAKLIIIGNKCDMNNQRQVSTEEGQQLANKCGALFYEVSCKNDINITEAFNAIMNQIYNERQNKNQNPIQIMKLKKKSTCF